MMPSNKGPLIGLILLLLILIWFATRKGVTTPAGKGLSGIKNGDTQGPKAGGDGGFVTSPRDEVIPPSPNMQSTVASVKAVNNLPVVKSIRLLPIPVSAGQAVRAEVITEDKDGDFVQLLYEWQVNGKPIDANDHNTLAGDQVHSADQILVLVTPSDPHSKGEALVSPLITVTNRPPEIVSLAPKDDQGKYYTYQIVAKDPDLDPLNYALLEGPSGMEVHPTTGLVHWEVVPLPKNKSHIALEVNDGKGGKAVQQFTLQTTSN